LKGRWTAIDKLLRDVRFAAAVVAAESGICGYGDSTLALGIGATRRVQRDECGAAEVAAGERS